MQKDFINSCNAGKVTLISIANTCRLDRLRKLSWTLRIKVIGMYFPINQYNLMFRKNRIINLEKPRSTKICLDFNAFDCIPKPLLCWRNNLCCFIQAFHPVCGNFYLWVVVYENGHDFKVLELILKLAGQFLKGTHDAEYSFLIPQSCSHWLQWGTVAILNKETLLGDGTIYATNTSM